MNGTRPVVRSSPSPATAADDAPLVPSLRRWAHGVRRIQLADGVVLDLSDAPAYVPGIVTLPGARLLRGTDGVPVADATGLLAVRRAQSAWLLDVTLQRLRERTSAGQPLAAHAHVRMRIAEAAVWLAEADSAAEVGGLPQAHRCVTAADELLAELHGGSSVLAASPGHLALFSGLLGLAVSGQGPL